MDDKTKKELEELREENKRLKDSIISISTQGSEGKKFKSVPEMRVAMMYEELTELRKSEKTISDAYLRIRDMLGAYNTNHGGEDRFKVTEKRVSDLLELKARYDELIITVGNAYENETRNQTALRYIVQAELGDAQGREASNEEEK